MSMCQSHLANAQRTIDTYARSAQMILGKQTCRRNFSSTSLPPSRSCTEAGVMTSDQMSPSVSTTMCRLRPTSFFSPVEATWPALFGRLDALAIKHGGTRLGLFASLGSYSLSQLGVQVFPSAILLPLAKVMKHNSIRRQIVRQATPRAAVAGDIQNGVDDFSPRILRRPAARLRPWHPRLDPPPLHVRQIGRVRVPSHALQITSSHSL